MGESELQMTEEAQEISGAIRGGQGDIDGEKTRKKRKYTRHTVKDQQEEQQKIIPGGIRDILIKELDKCEAEIAQKKGEIALLDAKAHEIRTFLGMDDAPEADS